ncbi:septal ring lytic transglycosylase RlpA family protein [Methylocella sp.]|uniref:septal ring lytic transglycosylase RlpA family protein n=1 Tax=Methylocella sp. TaxID=1978226 RepID=UPI003783B237
MLANWPSTFLPRAVTLGRLSSLVVAVKKSRAPRRLLIVAVAGAGAALGGCAQQPMGKRIAASSKEYFPSSKYGKASPRVIADGEPVPRGGGVYMVGKPYTVAGKTYYPSEKRFSGVGLASWYGEAFHGRRTANGEIYDRDSVSAAHPTMPLPCYARVTNLKNHRSIVVRVNDRGPFHENRIMDVSQRTAAALDFKSVGTARVKVEYLAPAGLQGSDDEKLMATLRDDGPARLDDEAPVMTAQAGFPVQTASLAPVAVPEREDRAALAAAASAAAVPAPSRRQKDAVAAEDESPEEAMPHAARRLASAPLPPMRPSDAASGRRVDMAKLTKSAR